MEPVYLKPAEAATRVRLSAKTLANLRHQGNGPTYIKRGGRVFYMPEDLDHWMAEGRRAATTDLPK